MSAAKVKDPVLTPDQEKLLLYIADYRATEGVAPSQAEMCLALGKKTNNPAYYLGPLIRHRLVGRARKNTAILDRKKPNRTSGLRNIYVTNLGVSWIAKHGGEKPMLLVSREGLA